MMSNRWGFVLGCAAVVGCAPMDLPRVSLSELCAQRASAAGREVWLDGPLDPTAHVAFRVDADLIGFPCSDPPNVCCERVTHVYAVACDDATIVLVPAELGDGSAERFPDVVSATLECSGSSDGTATGGHCASTCDVRQAPTAEDVLGLRGVLSATPTTLATGDLGHPVLIFSVREVWLRDGALERDAAPGFGACDASVPQAGCPCTGPQSLCGRGLMCGPEGVWIEVVDLCGIG